MEIVESAMLWIWLAIFILTVVIEAATQDFVSIWFSVGAIIALAICSFSPFWVEIIVFSIVSLLALILTRPLVKKMMARSARYTNVDEFIGKKIKVDKEITKFESGEAKINGIIYTAILPEEVQESIPEGSIVEVVALKGNKVVVKKIIE